MYILVILATHLHFCSNLYRLKGGALLVISYKCSLLGHLTRGRLHFIDADFTRFNNIRAHRMRRHSNISLNHRDQFLLGSLICFWDQNFVGFLLDIFKTVDRYWLFILVSEFKLHNDIVEWFHVIAELRGNVFTF